mgnify:FL=1
MIPEQIKISKTIASEKIFNDLNDYMIKIDYFDKKGTKKFENNIPLTSIFNSLIELHK